RNGGNDRPHLSSPIGSGRSHGPLPFVPLGRGGNDCPRLLSPLVVVGTTAPYPTASPWGPLPPSLPAWGTNLGWVPFPQAFRLGGRMHAGSPSPKPAVWGTNGLGDDEGC